MTTSCDYCGGPIESDRHVSPTSRCWTSGEEVDLTHAGADRLLYMTGWRVGRDQGDREGFVRGYSYGNHIGEAQARLTDEAFLDAVARRVHALGDLERAVSTSMRSTITAINAIAYRKRGASR